MKNLYRKVVRKGAVVKERIEWTHLFDVKREQLTERAIMGGVSVALEWIGDPKETGQNDNFRDRPFYLDCYEGFNPILFGRSLMKPFQMKPLVEDLASILTLEERALSLGSHSGDEFQIELLHKIAERNGVGLHLKTPSSQPLGRAGCPGAPVTQWHHPCSGKHLAILCASKLRGWNLEAYLDQEHPYNLLYLNQLSSSLQSQPYALASDGCGLVTPGYSLIDHARLFSTLARERDRDGIGEAAQGYPELIGGPGRLDTEILRYSPEIFAKEGADGLLGLAIYFPKGDGKLTVGIVIKLAAGYDATVLKILAQFILSKLGFAIFPQVRLPGQQICFNESFVRFIDKLLTISRRFE